MAETVASSKALPRFGDPPPWLSAPCGETPKFAFDSVAGRWVVLMFFGGLMLAGVRPALEHVQGARELFDDHRAAFFGVSVDPRDEQGRLLDGSLPGMRYFGTKPRFEPLTLKPAQTSIADDATVEDVVGGRP